MLSLCMSKMGNPGCPRQTPEMLASPCLCFKWPHLYVCVWFGFVNRGGDLGKLCILCVIFLSHVPCVTTPNTQAGSHSHAHPQTLKRTMLAVSLRGPQPPGL